MGGTMILTGGQPLYGTVRVPAAKNSVLPLLAAALLCEGQVRLRGLPQLSDVEACIGLLRGVGRTAVWQGEDLVVGGTVGCCRLPEREATRLRASILFCAPLLSRMGRAETALPGGCRIGARPIDLHLEGLSRMGAACQHMGAQRLVLTAPGGLHGADFTLRLPSVGATETLLLAAVCAKGETVLRGVACEPEIVDLANFLNRCGGCVEGAGSPEIRVWGRRSLTGCSFVPMPDRIYASTFACAAAAAGGRVKLEGCAPALYEPVLRVLARMGCSVQRAKQAATVCRLGPVHGVGRLTTGVWPGLATDAAPLVAAALLSARDQSSIEDIVFERRFACAEGFAKMGAQASVKGRVLEIGPCAGLRGAEVSAPDLRGGAALILAALSARGESRINGMEYVERGYDRLGDTLACLGARIR